MSVSSPTVSPSSFRCFFVSSHQKPDLLRWAPIPILLTPLPPKKKSAPNQANSIPRSSSHIPIARVSLFEFLLSRWDIATMPPHISTTTTRKNPSNDDKVEGISGLHAPTYRLRPRHPPVDGSVPRTGATGYVPYQISIVPDANPDEAVARIDSLSQARWNDGGGV